jgi:periplasmic protein TonB
MAEPLDILEERDPLAAPFLGALLIHGGVLALAFFGLFWMSGKRETLGDINPSGGPATAVSPVHSIPIPQREAPQNPVANDTQSTVPSAPAKQEQEKKPAPPDKDAVQIPDRVKREAERPRHQQQYQEPAPENQVYSRSRQALSNPMYSAPTGGGQVGVGPNTPLGNNRLGWYAELIRQRIAQNWNTNGLDSRTQNSPAIVSFLIMRDGHVRTPQVIQSSGNPSIDNTALRAVFQADPMPQLPPQITEPYISAQFTFNLR